MLDPHLKSPRVYFLGGQEPPLPSAQPSPITLARDDLTIGDATLTLASLVG